MATDYTKDPRWRWTVDTSKHQRLRDVRPQIAKAAGMSVDDALGAVRESHRLGEETEGTKALSKAFQSSEYRDLTMNSAGERSDINVRNVFDESSWGFIKQNRWFSQLVTAGLTAAVGGAAFAGVGAGGAAASGAGGGAANAAFALPTATEIGLATGAGNSALLAGTTSAGLSGVGAAAGAAAGVAATPAGGAPTAGGTGKLSAALKLAGSASSLLGGATSAGGAAGSGPGPAPAPPPQMPIAPGDALRPASPSVVQAAQEAKRRAAPMGRASTILTSGRGLLTKPNLGRKTLLGQ